MRETIDRWWARMLLRREFFGAMEEARGPGIHWHRVGPREHVVHIIREASDAPR
ncbi:MAG TPA: hypothetical protein VGN96_10410 [Roseococcus sp.]|jgi:hypothetical protein|nr:hypothetical protein [Roseococcus sp.]